MTAALSPSALRSTEQTLLASAQPTQPVDRVAVAETVGAAKTSFYLAMRILSKPRRDAMFAVYAFCRAVDDIADEAPPPGGKSAALDAWRQSIEAIYAGHRPTLPLAHALIEPIGRYGLLKADFMAVIDGMQMDADADICAPSMDELDLYCARVASAVGRLSVRIFGAWSADADLVADHLGRALQLTNILRDLDEDAARNRLYLPREGLLTHGITLFDIPSVLNHPGLDGVCRDLACQAVEHYRQADAAMRHCSRKAMRPARMMSAVYRATLIRLLDRGFTAPRAPVKLSKWRKLMLALASAV